MLYRVLERCGTANRKFLPGMEVEAADLPAQMDAAALVSAGVLELVADAPQPVQSEAPVEPVVVITESKHEES